MGKWVGFGGVVVVVEYIGSYCVLVGGVNWCIWFGYFVLLVGGGVVGFGGFSDVWVVGECV